MNADFEAKLKDLLEEHVDEITGPRRSAPPFDPNHTVVHVRDDRPHQWRLWITMLAAACLVGALATVLVTTLAGPTTPWSTAELDHPDPAGEVVRPDLTGELDDASPPAGTHAVHLAGATLQLPKGWVARDYRKYTANGQQPDFPQEWCLTPKAQPPSRKPFGCPVVFNAIVADSRSTVDVDESGGSYGEPPQYCAPHINKRISYRFDTRDFGGRPAEWRRFVWHCTGGVTGPTIEQYVVPTVPGYRLYSDNATASVPAAMAEIAANSTLPAQTLPLRLGDYGSVRSVVHQGDTVRVGLDRVVKDGATPINADGPTLYYYDVPLAKFTNSGAQNGSLVYLATNGSTVRVFQ